jgi:hypothetical protein
VAKSKRGSSENLFSISGASEALNRSRRTITRAMANIPADKIESGLKLWTMAKIVAAVNANTQAPILTTARNGSEVLTGLAAETHIAFEAYHAAEDRLTKLPTVEERRAAAPEVAALARAGLDLMRQRDTDSNLHPEHVNLRNDTLRLLVVRGLESLCEWTHVEAWACVDPCLDDEDEEAA